MPSISHSSATNASAVVRRRRRAQRRQRAVLLRDRLARSRRRRWGCRARRAGARTSRPRFALAIAATRFFADCVAEPLERRRAARAVSTNRSATSWTSPASTSCATTFSPSPSMFIWPRDAKNSIAASCCAGQPSRFGHSSATLPSSRSSAVPHDGHARRRLERRARPLLGDAEDLRDDLAGLLDQHAIAAAEPEASRPDPSCGRDARDTVVPETSTGSSIATGVTAPVRPTLSSRSSSARRDLARGELVRDRPARELRRSCRAPRAARSRRP